MNILCIETSAALCSVAVVKNKENFYAEDSRQMAHAEVLTALISDCMLKAGITMKALDAVALSGGPGSYTGLRIGCSTAKGLCYALGIPLIVIDTLKIAAAAARIKVQKDSYYWAMTDARRMEVYHALFDPRLMQLSGTTNGIITDESFTEGISAYQPVLLCGDGAAKASGVLQITDAGVVANASAMCSLAEEAYEHKDFSDVAYYEPFYLKQANITVSKS